MQIIHDITMDMARRLPVVPIHAVQGDGCTRLLRLTLLENGESWPLPENITAAVAFRKPDGTRGLYDTLPDGTRAVTMAGNTVTAILAPQALSCPGAVAASVVFYDANMNALATFPFQIAVAGNPAAGAQISNHYYALQNLDQVNAAYNDLVARLDNLGSGGNTGGSGGGISTTAITLLTDILKAAMFTTNVSGKIESLQEALLAGSSGDSGGGSGSGGGSTVADEITFADGMLTIITVGSDVSVADGIMTIL